MKSGAELVDAYGPRQRDVIYQQQINLVTGKAAVGQIAPDTNGQPALRVEIGMRAPPLMPGQQPGKIIALPHDVSASALLTIWPMI